MKVPTIAVLRSLSNDELIKRHDALTSSVEDNVSYYLDELGRRETAESNRQMTEITTDMHRMTRDLHRMTIVIVVMTAVTTVATIVGLLK